MPLIITRNPTCIMLVDSPYCQGMPEPADSMDPLPDLIRELLQRDDLLPETRLLISAALDAQLIKDGMPQSMLDFMKQA